MLHSIYDLTTSCRKTTGDVPAKLVGASTTVVGSKMYLFGGRLVTERRMVSDLYAFDLETFVWEKIQAFPEDDIPRPRYFHSADAWNNQLIIFGGMSNQPDSPNPDELCVLNDVRFFDLTTRHWIPASQFPAPVSETFVPRARYAHLSSVTADRLFIIGGQDFFNTWLDDVCVYDLLGKTWVQRRDYPRHCGTYRSVAVSSNLCVRRPQDEQSDTQAEANLGPPGTRFHQSGNAVLAEFTSSDSLVHLPYSTTPTEDYPSDIYLYSNYNFTDVKRELEVFSPLPDTDFTIQDCSSAMTGTTFPPGLRFPTGAILGSHLIIAGTYLAHSYQSFSIWVLDLLTMSWSRIDPGKAVESGSWFRGCLWAEANKFLIFGNRNGNLVDDYNRRLLSWDHVAVVDLEAFGIYQPPPLKFSLEMQELGLAALEEKVLADFEIICDDGRKISCSRKMLEERWPWFKERRRKLLQTAMETLQQLPTSPMHVDKPALPGATSAEDDDRPDPRLTPRSLHLSEPYPVTLALLRYFYSLALLTPLQLAPAVLSQLLVLATNYQLSHLESLVKHAMHRALSNSTSVGVYEVATLCGCRSLQIRALKTVMSYTQKKPSRRPDKENGGGGRPPDGGSGGGGPSSSNEGPSGSGGDKFISRPRGTSDAKWHTMGDSDTNNHAYNSHNVSQHDPRRPSARLHRNEGPESDSDDLSPIPLFTRPRKKHDRAVSAVSVSTDQELRDFADLLVPTINQPMERPTHDRAKSGDSGLFVDLSATARTSSADEWRHLSSQAPLIRTSSVSSEGHYDLHSPDGHVDRVYLPPSPAYPSFHLPLNQSRTPRVDTDGHSHDTSDLPSLTSSTSRSSLNSSKRHSPLTPATLVIPPEYTYSEPSPLSIIEEQGQEEHYWRHGEYRSLSTQRSFSESEEHSLPKAWPTKKSVIEWNYQTPPSLTTLDSQSPEPISPPASITSPTKSSSFSRLLRREKGGNFGNITQTKLPLDNKALKAEEKRRKKEEAKARTEKLAMDLKRRQEERKKAASDRLSVSSAERKKKEMATLYGGFAEGIVM
uniref:Regulatory protein ral2 n=1 Tax=Moniliophthora roreri TaxID=221103 RepID=A0A0W0FUG0_MONRR